VGVGVRSREHQSRQKIHELYATVFLEVSKPQPVVLFELVKGWVTGEMPDLGEIHHVQK
jgi:hypothetical protein